MSEDSGRLSFSDKACETKSIRRMQNMKLLSVIIPIYNVEDYIERCIRSLETQDLHQDDYEIICINDGSPDNSREIIASLLDEFNNIILMDQENGGVSVARNAGIDIASGKYILFIDPDDYVLENTIGAILKEAISNKAQMTIPGYIYLDPDRKIRGKKIFNNYKNRILDGIEAYHILRGKNQKRIYPSEVMIADSSVGILFEAEFFKGNAFKYVPGVILNQDCELLARIHSRAESCILPAIDFYCVVERKDSATRSSIRTNHNVIKGYILAAESLSTFQMKQCLSAERKLFLNGPIVQFVILTLSSAVGIGSFKKLWGSIWLLKAAGLGKLKLQGCSPYHRICGKAYNISPYLGVIIITIYLRLTYIFKIKLKRVHL